MRWIKNILMVVVVLLAGGYLYWYLNRPVEREDFETEPSRLKEIREMADLCTLDFHEEIAIKDQADGKWIVAKMTVEGSVRYDLDSLRFEERGDTVMVTLPKERIEILESAEPGSYEVLDSWDQKRIAFGRKLTAAEENGIKQRARGHLEQTLRSRGYVKRARENASATLRPLLQHLYPSRPVKIEFPLD